MIYLPVEWKYYVCNVLITIYIINMSLLSKLDQSVIVWLI